MGSNASLPRLPKTLRKTLEQVLSVPSAPFREHWLRDYLERRLQKLPNVRTRLDRSGNLWVRYRPKGGKAPSLCLQAHMDHPGFVAEKAGSKPIVHLAGFGGLPENCVGAAVRIFRNPDDSGIRGKVTAITKQKLGYEIDVAVHSNIPAGSIGMWDIAPLRSRGPWLEGRSFDDNLGIGILVYVFERLVKKQSREALEIVFTRAEEVGYIGLLDAAKRRSFRLPKRTLTIEMPRAGGELVAGNGVMLRAGDRNVNFDADALLFIEQTAVELKQKLPWFKAQRRLGLFGGTEVGVFYLLGAQTSCLCLPVENGHNIDLQNKGRPAPERVHSLDLLTLVALLEELASRPWRMDRSRDALKQKMLKNAALWAKKL